ncbi:MAG TPA: DUF5668 domain-containing protein [Bryobacteraceae bacterium]|nr:DUF5668 domain-containing protein [Bryobacteraceae bacterium]
MNGNNVSLARALRGPLMLITVGVLFALNNFTPYSFDQTWPVILIVFGLMTLLRRGIPRGTPYEQPYSYAPPAGSTGYRKSPYEGVPAPPASGPVKGGFGASAPPRTGGDPPAPGTPPQGGTA